MNILCLLMLVLVVTTMSNQQSQCFNFNYRTDDQGWDYGHIQIWPPPDFSENVISLSVRFNVSLDIESSNYFSLEPDADIKSNLKQGFPIKYRVKFPHQFNPRQNLPILVSLVINGETLCGKPLPDTLPDYYSNTVTLHHTTKLDSPDFTSDQQPLTPAPSDRFDTGLDNGFGIYNKLERVQNPGSGQTVNIDQLQINHFHFNTPQDLQPHRLYHDFFKKDPLPGGSDQKPGNGDNFPGPGYVTGIIPSDSTSSIATFESVRSPGDNRFPPEYPVPPIIRPPLNNPPPPPPWISELSNPPLDRLSGLKPSHLGSSRPDFSAPIPWMECGISPNRDLGSLPTSGSYERGDWPWVVAILRRQKEESKFNFICVGSLVTAKHVITAAHCIALRHETVPIEDIQVKVGAFDLSDSFDVNTQLRKVVDVEIFETYNATTLENDIGILTLDTPVFFDRFTKPVCLWYTDPELSKVVGTEGIVAGWGESEDTMIGTGTPNYVKMPIVSTQTCRSSNTIYLKLTSHRTLCAGGRNGIGPCRGDSGGGLYVMDNGRWKLRGIVSLSLRQKFGQSSCNLDEYVVFTDTAQYRTWIDRYILDYKISPLLPQGQYASGAVSQSFGYGYQPNAYRPSPTFGQSPQIFSYPQRPILQNSMSECGILSFLSEESPWLVAIYKKIQGNFIFSCAGTLVSDRHVITAAQCMQSDSIPLPAKDIIIKAGVSNLEDLEDDYSITRTVSSVIVHKDFNLSTLTDDIAILKLKKSIRFTPNIRPICLWSNDVDFNRIVGSTAEISSWGLDRDTPVGTGNKSSTRLVVLDHKTCSASRPYFNFIGTSFCAGGVEVTCLKELGGGLAILDNGRWTLRGVASQLQGSANESSCNSYDNVVFTDVARYLSWIRNFEPDIQLKTKPLYPTTPPTRPIPGPSAYTPSSNLSTYANTIRLQQRTNDTECGLSPYTGPETLDTAGTIQRGDWPWVVAIYGKVAGGIRFLCIGTLVSEWHVTTAAHCIKQRTRTRGPQDVIVKAGPHILNDWNEEGSQYKSLSSAFIHENFDPITLSNDIAILTFSTPVKLTKFVRPACIWNGDDDLAKVVGHEGVVTGWGESEDGTLPDGPPNYAKMPIVSQVDCLRSNPPAFSKLTSNNTLCAGERNGVGPCAGDSGGGLYVAKDRRWMLRAIVSLALSNKEEDKPKCDLFNYVVFTDITKFLPWIREAMSQPTVSMTNSALGLPSLPSSPIVPPFGQMSGPASTSTTTVPTPVNTIQLPQKETTLPTNQTIQEPQSYLNAECGVSPYTGPETLDIGGTVERGDWPWAVAIYWKTTDALKFVCIGSLVSEWHVITAAHCIKQRTRTRGPQDLIVKAGPHILNDWSEEGSQYKSLSSAFIHENFDPITLSNDIAILTFKTPVKLTKFVRPACLWNGDDDLAKVVGHEGVVTGWGESEDGTLPDGPPNYAKMPIVSQVDCLRSNPAFSKLTSNNTLCAGERNGVGPCAGDSGGGLYVAKDRRWMLRAIVSLVLSNILEEDKPKCDLFNYVVFTDITKFLPWIREAMSQPTVSMTNSALVLPSLPSSPIVPPFGQVSGPASTSTTTVPTPVNTIQLPQKETTLPTNQTIQEPQSYLNTECGVSPYTGPETLDIGGTVERGDWPWAVAIYWKTTVGLKFVCIGSLVSEWHVITAGHCIKQRSFTRGPEEVIVRAGPHILTDWTEEGSQTKSLSSVDVHTSFDTTKISNDIAILTFKTPLKSTKFVRPACIWNGDDDLAKVVGYEGIVTGWGESEVGTLPDGPPNYAKMPIVSQVDCLRSNQAFSKLTSNNTLCAGARNGAGPCVGDSGGGLYVAENRRWMLRAIVSLALTKKEDYKLECDLFNYVVFTDIAKFLPWIREVMSKPTVSTTKAASGPSLPSSSIVPLSGPELGPASTSTTTTISTPVDIPSAQRNPNLSTNQTIQGPQSYLNAECGVSPYTGPETLDIGGTVERGDWPWAVAIYWKTTDGLKFVCIGSLVSEWHVTTAGHCIQQRRYPRPPEEVIVRAGPHILSDWAEEGSQTKALSSIVVHRSFDSMKLSNDIAILTFNTPVKLTKFVRPACLWNGDDDLDKVVGYEGVVTGWGVRTNVGTLPDGPPNFAKMPIVSQVDCLRSNQAFMKLTSNNTLCAGSRNGAGPCVGDAGGGLYVAENRRWMLRAIVSLALSNIDDDKPKCDLFNYVVFTDIAKFLPWIREVISQPPDTVDPFANGGKAPRPPIQRPPTLAPPSSAARPVPPTTAPLPAD